MNRVCCLSVMLVATAIGCGGSEKSGSEKNQNQNQKQTADSKTNSTDAESMIARGQLIFIHTYEELRGTRRDIFCQLLEVDGIEPIRRRKIDSPEDIEFKNKMMAAIEKKFGKGYFEKKKSEAYKIWRFQSQTAKHKEVEEMIKNSKSKVISQ